MKVKFLIADACPVMRTGIRHFVEGAAGTELLGEAGDEEETLRRASELQPDKIVLDPRFDGGTPNPLAEAALCRKLKSASKTPSLSIYATHDSPAEIAALARAGADHYVHKRASIEDLSEAWRRDRAGESVWMVGDEPKYSMPSLLSMLQRMDLTNRQLEVLVLLLRRYSDAQIAKKLHVTLQTAKNHKTSIFKKLGVQSRQALYDKFLM